MRTLFLTLIAAGLILASCGPTSEEPDSEGAVMEHGSDEQTARRDNEQPVRRDNEQPVRRDNEQPVRRDTTK